MEAVKRKEKKVVSVHPLVLKCDTSLKDHKELDEPINTEEAKNIELDEQPKPTRKVTNPSYQFLINQRQEVIKRRGKNR